MNLREPLLELIRSTSTDLSDDVVAALENGMGREAEGSRARSTLSWMLKNAVEAKSSSFPVCQDTGTLVFYIDHGNDFTEEEIAQSIRDATAEATDRYYLRKNAVDPITGKNSGNNLGYGSPYMHFHHFNGRGLTVRLMLKGGGSENCGIQYSLPFADLDAGRDITGIRKCVVDAVFRAQGFGCAPGTLGIGIGGDRMSSYMESKEQFFRRLDDTNPDPVLAELESELYEKVNLLDIGPMGFGGKTTVLGVKIGIRHRVPASFFIAVSYMCWAYRRRSMKLQENEFVIE
jgi:fumarate hydratase class I